MARLEYVSDYIDNREMSKIIFEFEDDLTIDEFKIICKRLASAIGYTDGNIKTTFGDDTSHNIDEEYKELIKSVFESNAY
jgi:phosphotransferase system IIB component